mgnify:CR=1 FL=1
MNLEQMFLNPERLWWLLLIPVLVALYVVLSRRKNRSGMRFTNTGVLGAVVPPRPSGTYLTRVSKNRA